MSVVAFYRRHAQEIHKLARFMVVGVISTALYAGAYALLSRYLWRQGNHTLENFIATAFASVFNFYANRNWTFCTPDERPGTHLRHVKRYITVLVVAMVLQSALFWFFHEFIGIYDFAVVFLVTLIMPLFTYLSHRLYTFRSA